ncbi:MAG TPA: diaminopimelate epimerase [Chitinivibrionales bacterium]|jgi:diaminopimelate epimerase|nr:diaminopimelate epimerase [Chitinivibrionales bacterium]
MKFAKIEGLANDFIVTADTLSNPGMLPAVRERAGALCDRRRGIGADGVLCVVPSSAADFGMRVFNADGSEAEMCGNGVRCFALYLKNTKLWDKPQLSVETAAGIIRTSFEGDQVRVDMGPPVLNASQIPVAKSSGEAIGEILSIDKKEFTVTAVSMGNPHVVVYADELTDELVLTYGKRLESHPFFPKRANVEFVKVLSKSEIRMRVYERGCGETMACGTGACASVVSGVLNGLNDTKVIVHLLGGDLLIEWSGDRKSPVYMTGPARWVYAGEIAL